MPDAPQQQKLRLKDKRTRLAWVKVAAGASVTAMALILVWYVARIPALTVAELEVTGTVAVDSTAVEEAAANAIAGSYFYLIPRKNVLVLPKEAMTAAVLDAFPEIADVSVTREGKNSLHIVVSERTASAMWCTGTPAQPGACYHMDKNGYVFAEAARNESFIKFFGNLSDEPVGETYVDGDFASLKRFVEELSSTAHRTPESVMVEENDDVTVAFVQGGVLKFVRSADRAVLLDNIASVFSARDAGANETLDYADFRYGDKVYVKFLEH